MVHKLIACLNHLVVVGCILRLLSKLRHSENVLSIKSNYSTTHDEVVLSLHIPSMLKISIKILQLSNFYKSY